MAEGELSQGTPKTVPVITETRKGETFTQGARIVAYTCGLYLWQYTELPADEARSVASIALDYPCATSRKNG